jgi:pteridine reductase
MSGNRVALVTGGSRRVGRSIVEKFAASGFDVAFTYLSSREDAEEVTRRIHATGRQCIAIEADLTQPTTAVDRIAAEIESLGRLDVLVNSASIYHAGSLQDSASSDSTRMWTIHVEAPLLLCQRFEKFLRASRGHVINMADLLAERPWPQYLAYSASKAALWNLTLGLARALAPDVTVNGIDPGVVEWPEDYPQAEREKYLKRVPLARPGTPQDVAELVHFLCTSGTYITGQIIRLDGGRSIT